MKNLSQRHVPLDFCFSGADAKPSGKGYFFVKASNQMEMPDGYGQIIDIPDIKGEHDTN